VKTYVLARNPTDSVTLGFFPAAERLGLDVTVLTDQPEAHAEAGAVALHLDGDAHVERIALSGRPLAVLTGDLAAGDDGVVVDELDGLRRRLAAGLLTHLAPLVEAVRERSRLGPRVRWGRVADSLGTAFLELGRLRGDLHAARTEADALFAVAAPVLRARPTWVPVEQIGTPDLLLRRSVCCLAYKTPDHGYCTGCPCISDQERLHRFHAPPPTVPSAGWAGSANAPTTRRQATPPPL
jgi:hypothetical protein